ncbi:hypothetical protein [uncultured Gilvimarinus sp.]|uniref:hypothetical protein n=1 Tax=uncultured Gilvimarinus sp. TaxID=1689143 RepID=UPI0030EEA958|tara:strand:- start:1783 stop:2076 length:294 start_codon:yes stop_codon:yes gene_type:complete
MSFNDYWKKNGNGLAKRHEGEDDRAFARRIVKAAHLASMTEERNRCIAAVQSVEGVQEAPDHVLDELQDRKKANNAVGSIVELTRDSCLDAINATQH